MLKTTATVRKVGNSNGVILDKRICDALGISPGCNVAITVDNGCMMLEPERERQLPRVGIAKGEKLVPDEWFSEEADREVAAIMGVI